MPGGLGAACSPPAISVWPVAILSSYIQTAAALYAPCAKNDDYLGYECTEVEVMGWPWGPGLPFLACSVVVLLLQCNYLVVFNKLN